MPNPWRFQGRLDLMANPADPLYEWSARFYLPTTGAFSQLDAYPGSVGDPRSLNRYLYAAANPWTLIDPTGHAFELGEGGTWDKKGSDRFWAQRAQTILRTYSVDKFESLSVKTQNWVIGLAGQTAWNWTMNPANNPFTNPFAIRLAEWHALVDDPRHATARLNALGARVLEVDLADQDDARRNLSGWDDYWIGAFLATSLSTYGDAGEYANRLTTRPRIASAQGTRPSGPTNPESQIIYRQGGPNPGNLTVRPGETGLSFRDSLSNPYPLAPGQRPVFRPGDRYIGIDVSRLPRGSVTFDGAPPGHVTVNGVDPGTLRAAVVVRSRFPSW